MNASMLHPLCGHIYFLDTFYHFYNTGLTVYLTVYRYTCTHLPIHIVFDVIYHIILTKDSHSAQLEVSHHFAFKNGSRIVPFI